MALDAQAFPLRARWWHEFLTDFGRYPLTMQSGRPVVPMDVTYAS